MIITLDTTATTATTPQQTKTVIIGCYVVVCLASYVDVPVAHDGFDVDDVLHTDGGDDVHDGDVVVVCRGFWRRHRSR